VPTKILHCIIIIAALLAVLPACGYHFSENKTSSQDDTGKVIEKSQGQLNEDLVGPGLTPDREQQLRAAISAESVNTPFEYEKYGRGITFVMIAADWHNVESIRVLIEIGADPLIEDDQGRNAYAFAEARAQAINDERLSNGQEPIDFSHVTLALDGPAPINELNESLMTAAFEDNKAAVEQLIGEGADPNYQDERGETPLMAMVRGLSQKSIRPFLFMHQQEQIIIDFTLRNIDGETARGLAVRLQDEPGYEANKRVLQGFESFLKRFGAPL